MFNQVTAWKVLSIAAVVLLVVNTVLGVFNHGAQMAVGQRQAYIVQTQQVARISQQAAAVIGAAAEQDKNDALRTVLTKNGYTMRTVPGAPGPAAAPVVVAPVVGAPVVAAPAVAAPAVGETTP